jgi:hypothetical protein
MVLLLAILVMWFIVMRTMPRLTNQQYLTRRLLVLREWHDNHGRAFGFLRTSEQRALHDYFGTLKPFRPTEALEYRQRISGERPALAQAAGRAYILFQSARQFVPKPVSKESVRARAAGAKRQITVSPIVRPEIDVDRLARLLLKMARQEAEEGIS